MKFKYYKIINGEKIEFNSFDPLYNKLAANRFSFEDTIEKNKENFDWAEVNEKEELIAHYKDGTTFTLK